MTPVRAIFASLFAAVILAAGLFIVARLEGARPHDLVSLLSWDRTPFSLWSFLAAWGAVSLGALGVLGAFLAFIAPEDLDDPHYPRRGFPKSAPLFLVAAGLALAFIAFRAIGAGRAAPIAVALALEAPAPRAEPIAAEAPAAVTEGVGVAASAFSWRYMDPFVNDSGAVWGGYAQPFADEAESAALLCDAVWIAVSGSASEEGPPDRNARRARFRAELAMSRAERWLARHPECGETYVFGVDLGQHAGGAAAPNDGASTAYQRQILLAFRRRSGDGEELSVLEAEAELRDFLDDAENRRAFYAGRDFPRDPVILGARTTLAADWR